MNAKQRRKHKRIIVAIIGDMMPDTLSKELVEELAKKEKQIERMQRQLDTMHKVRIEYWRSGAKFALLQIAKDPIMFCSDRACEAAIKAATDACVVERDRMIAAEVW